MIITAPGFSSRSQHYHLRQFPQRDGAIVATADDINGQPGWSNDNTDAQPAQPMTETTEKVVEPQQVEDKTVKPQKAASKTTRKRS